MFQSKLRSILSLTWGCPGNFDDDLAMCLEYDGDASAVFWRRVGIYVGVLGYVCYALVGDVLAKALLIDSATRFAP